MYHSSLFINSGNCRHRPMFVAIMIDIVHVQVRIWNVERSQKEIINNMRLVDGIAGQLGLVAYWKFDDPNMCALKRLAYHACIFNALHCVCHC